MYRSRTYFRLTYRVFTNIQKLLFLNQNFQYNAPSSGQLFGICKRKQDSIRKQENTLSTKKATKKLRKKTITVKKRKRNHAHDPESDQEKRERVFFIFLTFLFSFKNSTSGLIMSKYIFADFFNSHVECGLARNGDLLSN